MQIDHWTDNVLHLLDERERQQLQDAVDQIAAAFEAQVCLHCGHTLGEHAYSGNWCPSDATSGPLWLDTRYMDEESKAARLRDIDCWIVNRGANA